MTRIIIAAERERPEDPLVPKHWLDRHLGETCGSIFTKLELEYGVTCRRPVSLVLPGLVRRERDAPSADEVINGALRRLNRPSDIRMVISNLDLSPENCEAIDNSRLALQITATHPNLPPAWGAAGRGFAANLVADSRLIRNIAVGVFIDIGEANSATYSGIVARAIRKVGRPTFYRRKVTFARQQRLHSLAGGIHQDAGYVAFSALAGPVNAAGDAPPIGWTLNLWDQFLLSEFGDCIQGSANPLVGWRCRRSDGVGTVAVAEAFRHSDIHKQLARVPNKHVGFALATLQHAARAPKELHSALRRLFGTNALAQGGLRISPVGSLREFVDHVTNGADSAHALEGDLKRLLSERYITSFRFINP